MILFGLGNGMLAGLVCHLYLIKFQEKLMFHVKVRPRLFVRPFRGIHFTTLIQLVPSKQYSRSHNYSVIRFWVSSRFW